MLDLIISTLTQGFIYAMLSYGIYITYKILDFPDLTVDGSFPLGAAVTALLLVKGVNPYLTLLAALAVGAAAGFVTGFIHVRLKVRDLLAGIITNDGAFFSKSANSRLEPFGCKKHCHGVHCRTHHGAFRLAFAYYEKAYSIDYNNAHLQNTARFVFQNQKRLSAPCGRR